MLGRYLLALIEWYTVIPKSGHSERALLEGGIHLDGKTIAGNWEELIEKVVHHACTGIAPDAERLLRKAAKDEDSEAAKSVLDSMLENIKLAEEMDKPVCQSPGYPAVYITFGKGSELPDFGAIYSKVIPKLTKAGYIRPSIVHPLTRKNSGDNSGIGVPNFEYDYKPDADYVEMVVSFKACGAELMNAYKTFTSSTLGKELSGLKKFIVSQVIEAKGIPCPPTCIGIGIGGQMDVAARLSRRAVSVRNWDDVNPDPMLADLESELLQTINSTGIGPGGTGGKTTALGVKVAIAYTHTAIAPVAFNFHCWVARRAGVRVYKDGRVEMLFWRGEK